MGDINSKYEEQKIINITYYLYCFWCVCLVLTYNAYGRSSNYCIGE